MRKNIGNIYMAIYIITDLTSDVMLLNVCGFIPDGFSLCYEKLL